MCCSLLNAHFDCFYIQSIKNTSIRYLIYCFIKNATKVRDDKLSSGRQIQVRFDFHRFNILKSDEAKGS